MWYKIADSKKDLAIIPSGNLEKLPEPEYSEAYEIDDDPAKLNTPNQIPGSNHKQLPGSNPPVPPPAPPAPKLLTGTVPDPEPSCVIEEEVFINNILSGLNGYAKTYFQRKVFTVSQDTFKGNFDPFARLKGFFGVSSSRTPLGPNTQVYNPHTGMTPPGVAAPLARIPGAIMGLGRVPLTQPLPQKDVVVTWDASDVSAIMRSLEKIAETPELQKYGAKEIQNILRYPLLQVKGDLEKVAERLTKLNGQRKNFTDRITNLAGVAWTPLLQDKIDSYQDSIKEIDEEINKLNNLIDKPEVEVVKFKEFYKLTPLSRYFNLKGFQLNGVYCDLETQLIKTLNNVFYTLGKVEKNKRIQEIYKKRSEGK
jgi:hypothetical protein